MKERRIRSIPRRTMRDVLREQKRNGFPGSSVSIGRLPREKSSKPLVAPEDERIMWEVEIIEDHDGAGDLGLVIQFSDISFMNTPVFVKSRHDYGPDSRVFYSPVVYKNSQAVLILATFGDIFESQVVPRKKDVNPFFQEEIYLPSRLTLKTPYDFTSMKPSYNNGLLIVSYKARILTP